jgi:hypothetical protein
MVLISQIECSQQGLHIDIPAKDGFTRTLQRVYGVAIRGDKQMPDSVVVLTAAKIIIHGRQ